MYGVNKEIESQKNGRRPRFEVLVSRSESITSKNRKRNGMKREKEMGEKQSRGIQKQAHNLKTEGDDCFFAHNKLRGIFMPYKDVYLQSGYCP